VWAEDSRRWQVLTPFPEEPGLVEFEVSLIEHMDESGTSVIRDPGRDRYNSVSMKEAARRRAAFVGELGGFHDFFVPVVEDGVVTSYLVCGPFRKQPLSANEIESQFARLWGGETRGAQAELLAYARCALGTVCLDSKTFGACEKLLGAVAAIMGGAPDAASITDRFIAEHSAAIDTASSVVFRMAGDLVDRKWNSIWRHPKMSWNFSVMNIEHMFTHALAVAFDARIDEALSPVERLVRAHDLQRHCVEMARDLKDTIAGRLGEYGAFFLTSCQPGAKEHERVDARAAWIREQARRRLGASLTVGISGATPNGEALPRCFDEAVLALNWGLHERRATVLFRERKGRTSLAQRFPYRSKVVELRNAVVAGARGAAEIAASPLSRAVMWRARGNVDATRACFDALVLELLEAVDQSAGLDARSLRVLERSMLARLTEARSLHALSDGFRLACGELAQSVHRPLASSRQARLEGARRYVDKHLHVPLALKDVAREAGFSERYFSSLFKRQFGVGFEKYLATRRLERARELLLTTDLPAARVSRDAGFAAAEHFFRAFKRAYGVTPLQCRDGAVARNQR
jgi:AraC-like DNA-binding protein